MTPAQRLYCQVLRTARGKALSMDEARLHAHRVANVYASSAKGAKLVRRTLPSYPWPLIEAPQERPSP